MVIQRRQHPPQPSPPVLNRRRFVTSAAIATATVAAGAASGLWLFNHDLGAVAAQSDSDSAATYETVMVRRGSLSSERDFNATVSYGEPWLINIAAAGTITGAQPEGSVIGFGESLVRVDDKPVTLARGEMPMYRQLRKIDTRSRDENGNRLELQTGPDVDQLQAFLLDQGFDANGKLEVDGEFGGDTETAVESWQEANGLPSTGRVDNTQLIFTPDPVRINTSSRVGDAFTTVEVTGADSKVLVDTSTRDRSALTVGTTVDIDINGTLTTGSVAGQEQITSTDGSRVWRTTVVADSALPAEALSAKVTATQTIADDVLLVPVASLLALSEGGFALEVPTGSTTVLVRVNVGEVLDGKAEVDGDIAEGDTVVIPT
ncbi:MAG: peptidoglycan-binding protein [Actinomycetia bacterium]|nr:peptidoglycan-binding protein [Actinomycetes bacterium]